MSKRSSSAAGQQDWFLVYGYVSPPTVGLCSTSDADFPYYIRGVRAERCLQSEISGYYTKIHCMNGQAVLSTFSSPTCTDASIADSFPTMAQALGCFVGERQDAYVAMPPSMPHTTMPKITSRFYSCVKVAASTASVPLPKSIFFTSTYATDANCQDAIAFDAFSFPQAMNHTKCVPFDNTQPTDAKYEHLGKIRYDYVFTQVGGGDLPLPVSQPSVHPLYSPAIGAMLSLVFCACIGMILYVLCNDKQRQYRQSRQHQALPVDSEHATAAAVPPTPSSSSPRHNLHNNDMDVHNVMIMIPSIHEEDP